MKQKKYCVLKDDLIFLLMKKGMPWASPSFDACNSWIYIGMTWESTSFDFVHPSSHHTILLFLHLNTQSIKNFTQSSLATLVHRNNKSTWFSFNTSLALHLKHYLLSQLLLKLFPSKEHQKKAIKMQMQILAEICQNRTAGEDDFFSKILCCSIQKVVN